MPSLYDCLESKKIYLNPLINQLVHAYLDTYKKANEIEKICKNIALLEKYKDFTHFALEDHLYLNLLDLDNEKLANMVVKNKNQDLKEKKDLIKLEMNVKKEFNDAEYFKYMNEYKIPEEEEKTMEDGSKIIYYNDLSKSSGITKKIIKPDKTSETFYINGDYERTENGITTKYDTHNRPIKAGKLRKNRKSKRKKNSSKKSKTKKTKRSIF